MNLFKKLLSLLLTVAFLSSFLLMPLGAVEMNAEEEELFKAFYDIYCFTDAIYFGSYADTSDDAYVSFYDDDYIPEEDTEEYLLLTRIAGYKIRGREYDLSTYAKFRDFLKTFFTDKAADEYIEKFNSRHKSFYPDRDNIKVVGEKLYIRQSDSNVTRTISAYAVKNVRVNGNTATADYIIEYRYPENYYSYYAYPAHLVKTSDGWRLDDSVIHDIYYSDEEGNYRIEDPNTGDSGVAYVAVALLSLIPLAGTLACRRRREY